MLDFGPYVMSSNDANYHVDRSPLEFEQTFRLTLTESFTVLLIVSLGILGRELLMSQRICPCALQLPLCLNIFSKFL